ncbi:serine hydrolase domain-containing protein [Aquimarina sediminis]|uniref:serine hydrolase domain-containing protein n=1 Tax=Aquimarina sediminis TaxID=2070536 RepID=UPI000C9FFE4F|nr:serine hydrolase domain-containing protein [Aquimarina sediminis]
MNFGKQSNYQKKNKKLRLIKVFFLSLITSFLTFSCSDDDATLPNDLSNDINNPKYVNILKKRLSDFPNNTQVAIALVRDGDAEFLGVINENNALRTTNNADMVFEIGSITKVFTSICLSDLVANNEVLLKETLQDQFDFTLQAGGDITFEQLANHTSGLPRLPTNVNEVEGFDPNDPYAHYSLDNLKSYLQNHVVLNSVSGTTYEYSNIGTGILGYTIAQKRNTTYEEMVQNIILNPLHMNSTTSLLENVDPSKLVKPRDQNGNIIQYWNFAETMTGAGSLKSSVSDMVKFIRKNFEDDPLYNLPQEKTFDRGDDSYMGLGWGIIEDEDSIFRVLLHDGGTGGFSSMLMLDKNKKTGVIILSNVKDYESKVGAMCNDFFLEINK